MNIEISAKNSVWLLVFLLFVTASRVSGQRIESVASFPMSVEIITEGDETDRLDITLADSQGRKTGFDSSSSKIVHEIPNSSYEAEISEKPDKDFDAPVGRVIKVKPNNMERFKVTVAAKDRCKYRIEADGYDCAIAVPYMLTSGETHSFEIYHSMADLKGIFRFHRVDSADIRGKSWSMGE